MEVYQFSSPRIDVNLCDNVASFPLPEFKLGKVLDPPLTALSLVTPSSPSTLKENTEFIMTFSDPPFPSSVAAVRGR